MSEEETKRVLERKSCNFNRNILYKTLTLLQPNVKLLMTSLGWSRALLFLSRFFQENMTLAVWVNIVFSLEWLHIPDHLISPSAIHKLGLQRIFYMPATTSDLMIWSFFFQNPLDFMRDFLSFSNPVASLIVKIIFYLYVDPEIREE